jgi:hypothetical protein
MLITCPSFYGVNVDIGMKLKGQMEILLEKILPKKELKPG